MKKLTVILSLAIGSSLPIICEAQYTDLLNFKGPDGSNPCGSLIFSGNKLYGMANNGGKYGDGCVFSLNKNGSGYKDLHDFNDTLGAVPWGTLVISGSMMYGMTEAGGHFGDGCIFSIDTNGSGYKVLYDFNGSDGKWPAGSLAISGNVLYGMTIHGGVGGVGNIFSIQTDGGNFRLLFSFDYTNGAYPWGTLTVLNNRLFGMTHSGGAYNNGNVFSINMNGSGYKNLLDFNGTNGKEPEGDLTLMGNVLYGMTNLGGADNLGVLFSIHADGSHYKDLLDFDGTNGRQPYSDVIVSGNLLYGMTYFGGANNVGVVFSINTDGTEYNDLLDFNNNSSPAGKYPEGNLILSDNVLFGMTSFGGSGDGVVFSLGPCTLSASTDVLSNVSCNSGSNGGAAAILTGGTSPYSYSWSPYGGTNDTATGLSAGTYTVIVNDANGCSATASVTISQPASLSVSIYPPFNVGCYGGSNGSASADVNGGTLPYTYLWSNGQTTGNASLLSAGTYTVTVTDSCGASGTATTSISQPPALSITADSLPDNGTCSGSAWVSVSSGISPYTYFWTGGNTTDSINSQCYGSYCCLVKDADGCMDNVCINIPLIISTGTKPLKEGDGITVYPNPNNGQFTIQLSMAGNHLSVEIYNIVGEKVYSAFTINNPQFTIDLSSKPNGIYFYRVLNQDSSLLSEGKIIIQK